MQMFIKCDGDRISDVTFKVFGCGAAIAACSILSQEIKGSRIGEALKISEGISEAAFSQLPQEKMTCFNPAADALRLAIEEYRSKQPEPSLKEEFQKNTD